MRNTTMNGLILAAVSLWVLGLTVQATEAPTNEARLKLRLFAFVPDASASVDTMKEKVVTIFAWSSIQVSWVECIRKGEATGDSQCSAPRTTNEVYVRIVPGEAGRDSALDPSALGFTAPAGSLVTLFYRAAEKLSGPGGADIGQVLGCAAAHELGHIVLGAAHDRWGLMQPRWTKKTVTEILRGRLAFSNQQAELLKAYLLVPCNIQYFAYWW